MTSDADSERPAGPPAPTLVVPASIRDAIVGRARDGRPAEICGVLGGEFDADRARVRSQYPADNAAETPRTRYRIDPQQQLSIFDRLEGRGEEIVGFYHSHPTGPPHPSATDAAMATWPDRSYLIVSLEPFELGSWRWCSGTKRDGSGATDDGAAVDDCGAFERERLVFE
ncbi:M67 family peptidase [Natrarchaeobius halalkaliphilus]|uniref:M67 family peptidase n=1 Tax=Natrarchaeobius halalkaliphilus TaxID=1679091 RepID=A0A3N6M1R6_9EURY|nr:desampylase [Natrarchaeobius halalkaliphilus]RQG89031.1 M67 family peptidase [Natrarchaeobius halalkaliphilus]